VERAQAAREEKARVERAQAAREEKARVERAQAAREEKARVERAQAARADTDTQAKARADTDTQMIRPEAKQSTSVVPVNSFAAPLIIHDEMFSKVLGQAGVHGYFINMSFETIACSCTHILT